VNAALRYAGQGVLYALFLAVLGYFSSAPAYHTLGGEESIVRLTLTHAAQPKQPCRRRTAEELEKLPPNMRAPLDCPRGRANVVVELDIDGKLVTRVESPPSGFAHDGPSTVYRRLVVPAGLHTIRARLSDNPEQRFNFAAEHSASIQPGRVLTVDFNAASGGFAFIE